MRARARVYSLVCEEFPLLFARSASLVDFLSSERVLAHRVPREQQVAPANASLNEKSPACGHIGKIAEPWCIRVCTFKQHPSHVALSRFPHERLPGRGLVIAVTDIRGRNLRACQQAGALPCCLLLFFLLFDIRPEYVLRDRSPIYLRSCWNGLWRPSPYGS